MSDASTGNGHAFGRYEVVARLASGSSANIFLARQPWANGEGRLVCLKVMLSDHAFEKRLVRLFLDEAKLASQLNHPNCAEIYDLGKVQAAHYVSMEYICGESLWGLLVDATRSQVDLPPTHVAAIIMGVCDGLHHAHELRDSAGKPLNVVHKDVSPQKIMIGDDGRAKIVDFGITQAEATRPLSVTGQVKGQLSYMSPEQMDGRTVDRRSDVFSLGVVMFESLAGHRLLGGRSPNATARMILGRTPPRLKDVVAGIPPVLDEICARALCADPDDRYASAEGMAMAIRAYLADAGWDEDGEGLAHFMTERFGPSINQRRRVCAAVMAGVYDPEDVYATLGAHPVRHVDLYYSWPNHGTAADLSHAGLSFSVPAPGDDVDGDLEETDGSGAPPIDLSAASDVFDGDTALSIVDSLVPVLSPSARSYASEQRPWDAMAGLQTDLDDHEDEVSDSKVELVEKIAESVMTVTDPAVVLREAVRGRTRHPAPGDAEDVADEDRTTRGESPRERDSSKVGAIARPLSLSFNDEIDVLLADAVANDRALAEGDEAMPGSLNGPQQKPLSPVWRSSPQLNAGQQHAGHIPMSSADSLSNVWAAFDDDLDSSFDVSVDEKELNLLSATLSEPPPPPPLPPPLPQIEHVGAAGSSERYSFTDFRSPIEIGPHNRELSPTRKSKVPARPAGPKSSPKDPATSGATWSDPSAEHRSADRTPLSTPVPPKAVGATVSRPVIPRTALGVAFAFGLMMGLLLGLVCARFFLLPLVMHPQAGIVAPHSFRGLHPEESNRIVELVEERFESRVLLQDVDGF